MAELRPTGFGSAEEALVLASKLVHAQTYARLADEFAQLVAAVSKPIDDAGIDD